MSALERSEELRTKASSESRREKINRVQEKESTRFGLVTPMTLGEGKKQRRILKELRNKN